MAEPTQIPVTYVNATTFTIGDIGGVTDWTVSLWLEEGYGSPKVQVVYTGR